MKIDRNHPRYLSLTLREKLVQGVKKGLTSQAGLIAHGRGEAFDYIIGEKTHRHAHKAIHAAAAYLLLAQKPIISVNGNSSVLCAKEFTTLANILNCYIEVNLFHFSLKRIQKIENYLKNRTGNRILSYKHSPKMIISGIASKRSVVIREGIGTADCILVPLEDGDRCEALVKMGKKVIAIDLNPLSRTSKWATVAIVDNIVRCMPLLIAEIKQLKNSKEGNTQKIIEEFDNKKNLNEALAEIRYDRLT